MIDQYFIRHPEVLGTFDPRGVNPSLVFALRKALDEEGFQHVDIVVTGGFDENVFVNLKLKTYLLIYTGRK